MTRKHLIFIGLVITIPVVWWIFGLIGINFTSVSAGTSKLTDTRRLICLTKQLLSRYSS